MNSKLAGRALALAAMLTFVFAASASEPPWVETIRTPQYFAVRVADVDASVDWYVRLFGLKQLDDSRAEDGRWRIVNLANEQLSVEIIYDKRDSKAERARGIAKVGFRVPDVEAVADRVEKALGERPRIVDFEKHGVRILQLRDPEGNVVQLTSPIEPQ